MGVSGTRIGFLVLLSKAGKVPNILQPCSVKSIFNVLGVINNCAKFQQILITTSFSMDSP